MLRPRLLLVLLAVAAFAVPSLALASDEVSPAQDNPKGCVTATSSADDGCGAQGRDHFANAAHKPPIHACKTTTAATGSVVTRILPAGPLRADKSLAFTSGACVYLPPGYDMGQNRYPVLYLLHGGGGDEADWVTFGGVRSILDASFAKDKRNAIIAVMPDGRDAQWYDYYNRRFLIETYVLDYLLPYVDRHLRTIPDRKGRAIVGLSNGGYGAMNFASKRPDLFAVAGSMSGNVGARAFGDLGTPVVEGGPAFQEAGTYYYGNVPVQLATNLDGVGLIMDWGASCSSDIAVDLCATWAFEQSFRYDNQALHDRLLAVDHKGDLDYRETEGSHAWRWWTKWLTERHLPFALAHLADPVSVNTAILPTPVPGNFRYRSIKRSFQIWGYRVDAASTRPSEFLDLMNVRTIGMTVQGSGRVTIRTAARYTPNRDYIVSNAGLPNQRVTADKYGRLQFVVDLGPEHSAEEFSPAGRFAEAQGNYWTTRRPTIAPA